MKSTLIVSTIFVILCFASQSVNSQKIVTDGSQCFKAYTVLKHDESEFSVNKKFRLHLNPNGNLVLSNGDKTTWESDTANRGVPKYKLMMAEDGNLVLLDGNKKIIWRSSNKRLGNINNTLEVGNNGKINILTSKGKKKLSNDQKDFGVDPTKKPVALNRPSRPATELGQPNGTCPPEVEGSTDGVRFVKIIDGHGHLLVSQVVVTNTDGENVARGKKVSNTTPYPGTRPEGAVDGVASPRSFPNGFCILDKLGWWMVDLGSDQDVKTITLYNRTDCCQNRIAFATVQLLDKDQKIISQYKVTNGNPIFCINAI